MLNIFKYNVNFIKLISFTFFLFSTQIHSKEAKKINLSISNEGKFDVTYHRFESTVTGAVIAGLIGGTIEEGIRKGKDNKKKNEVLKLISNATCKDRLINSLIEKLEANDFAVNLEIESKINRKAKYWLDINILKCGLKMVNSTTKEVSTYVVYKTIVRDKNKVVAKKKHSITAKNQYDYLTLISDVENLNAELSYALNKAGKRLANKLIYN